MKPRTASGQEFPDRPTSGPGAQMPPAAPPPPRRIYNIVEPTSLARVYAAAYSTGDGFGPLTRQANGRDAVLDFITLMREDFE